MWLNGGYYYRGMVYHGAAVGTLSQHLGGPPAPPHGEGTCGFGDGSDCPHPETSHSESDWKPVFDFIELNQDGSKRHANDYSGEDWPQIIGTWDAIYFPHIATTAMCIPEADDRRRARDLCPCMGRMGGQHPDCDLPGWRQVDYAALMGKTDETEPERDQATTQDTVPAVQ